MNQINPTVLIDNYAAVVKAEISLFSVFSELLEKLKVIVRERNWLELEQITAKLNAIGNDIGKIENTRHAAFCMLRKKYGLPADAPVKSLAQLLGSDWGKLIATLSLELKLEVIKVQTQGKSLGSYIKNVLSFLNGFFEELYPHTKGKIYSRQGKTKENTENPVVVNTSL